MRRAELAFSLVCILVLGAVAAGRAGGAQPAPKTVPIPREFKSVNFSHDGRRVAFGAVDGKQYRAIVDGKPEQLYDDVTVVEFSPRGNHYYYGGRRDGQWYLVRDGKEITRLGSLTSLNRGTGLFFLGEGMSVTIWSTLAIWFGDQSDSYFVLAYQGKTGKVFQDGAWSQLEYRSFYHEGMAISPDGKHHAISVEPAGSGQAHMYLDGEPISQFQSIDDAAFLQPGNQLIYCGDSGGTRQMMLRDKPFPGIGPLAGMVLTSPDHKHFVALVKTASRQQAVVVDGKREASCPKIHWAYRGFLSSPGSFVWSKDGTSHAYVVNITNEKTSPQAVIYNGNLLDPRPEIRGSSLVLTPDGKHVAYAAKEKEGWAVVVDNKSQEKFEDIGSILFTGTGGKVVYAAKKGKSWFLCGAASSQPLEAVAGLTSDASGAHLAYAAKTANAKWQVFVDGKPVGAPCDGVIARPGIHVSESGDVSFTAKMGDQLVWFGTKPQ